MARTQSREDRKKFLFVIAVLATVALLNKWGAGELGDLARPLGNPRLQLFTILVLAILLEGFPFLLAGSFISGAIEVLVPKSFLEERVFPRGKLPAAAVGSLLGIFFPVCSCGNIPVARRLLGKGVPVAGVVGYLLAAPVLNPVTLFSTAMAFPAEKAVLFGRTGLAFFVALLAGLFLGNWRQSDILKDKPAHDPCDHCHLPSENRLARVIRHAEHDFFLTGRYLVLGACVAALFQTLIPRSAVNAISTNVVVSVGLLQAMGMAFSLCSFADAFVASTFTGFPAAAKTAFLVAGPTASAALIALCLGTFQKKFAVRLIACAAGGVFILASAAALLGRLT